MAKTELLKSWGYLYYPQQYTDTMQSLYILKFFFVFTEVQKSNPKFILTCKGGRGWFWITKTILKKINKVVELALLNFKTYCKTNQTSVVLT